MSDEAPPEVDVEDVVVAWLSGKVIDEGSCRTRMPHEPPMPFVLVQRIAGGDDWITDEPTVSVHSFDTDQTSASDLARRVHHRIRTLTAKESVRLDDREVSVNYLRVQQSPQWQDYQDPIIMRYVARYEIDLRLPPVPGY